jgi:hypothetical protein
MAAEGIAALQRRQAADEVSGDVERWICASTVDRD